jgi:regulator of replication initiation timing
LAQELAHTSPAFCHPKTTPRRLTLAEMSRLDYCIYKQHSQGLNMDPYEIEDTSNWLGTPSRLETVKHYASMLEEDIQELKRQLEMAKENITSFVEMNDQLTSELQKKRTWMANLEAETTEQLSEISSLRLVLDQKERIIRQLEAGKQRG